MTFRDNESSDSGTGAAPVPKVKGAGKPVENLVPEHKKELKRVAMRLLDGDPLNPTNRTELPAVRRLLNEIRQSGIHSPIHVILYKGRYLVVDGHRRYAVARILEHTHIECIIHHLPLKYRGALWCTLSIQRPIKAFDWMEAWYKSEGARRPPAKHLGHINNCQRIFGGRTGIKYLLDHEMAPTVCQVIDQLSMYFTRSSTPMPTSKEIGEWVVERDMQAMLQQFLATHPNVKTLKKLATAIRAKKETSIAKLYPQKRIKGEEGNEVVMDSVET